MPPRSQSGGTARRRRRNLGLLAVVLGAAAVVFRGTLFFGNFGVVEQGRVYRSAQPSGTVARLVKERRLGSVLNLRGGSVADPWYDEEVRVTRGMGVDFYDFPMGATRRPSRKELLTLTDLFGRCRYPLLIHCKSGSDRTGLVSALYLLAVKGVEPAEARGAFSLWYGHVPGFGTEKLHEPIDEYAAWLVRQRLSHTPERFRNWVEREYRSDDPPAAFTPLRPGPRDRLAARAARSSARGGVR